MRRIALVLALVLAACGGGGDDDTDTAVPSSTSTSTSTSTTTTADDTTTTSAGAATTTTATAPTAGGGADAAGAGAAPAPLAPGTYHYRQSGSTKVGTDTFETPPEGTSVADAARGDGTQVHHRYVDPEGESSDVTLRFGADGIFILETVLRTGQAEVRCTFDPPMASPPWPPSVGTTSSGHGECGAFTTDITSEITEARTVTLEGATYDAVVVESTLTTSGQLESTSHQVDWFVPELRMSTHTETDSTGSFGAFTFESSGTSDLLSATPT